MPSADPSADRSSIIPRELTPKPGDTPSPASTMERTAEMPPLPSKGRVQINITSYENFYDQVRALFRKGGDTVTSVHVTAAAGVLSKDEQNAIKVAVGRIRDEITAVGATREFKPGEPLMVLERIRIDATAALKYPFMRDEKRSRQYLHEFLRSEDREALIRGATRPVVIETAEQLREVRDLVVKDGLHPSKLRLRIPDPELRKMAVDVLTGLKFVKPSGEVAATKLTIKLRENDLATQKNAKDDLNGIVDAIAAKAKRTGSVPHVHLKVIARESDFTAMGARTAGFLARTLHRLTNRSGHTAPPAASPAPESKPRGSTVFARLAGKLGSWLQSRADVPRRTAHAAGGDMREEVAKLVSAKLKTALGSTEDIPVKRNKAANALEIDAVSVTARVEPSKRAKPAKAA